MGNLLDIFRCYQFNMEFWLSAITLQISGTLTD